MIPALGQRWSYRTGIIEVIQIAPDKSWYNGVVIQQGDWAIKVGHLWIKLPGWANDKALESIWTYMEGQDAPVEKLWMSKMDSDGDGRGTVVMAAS